MKKDNAPSMKSPKNKFRASIHYDKPLEGLSSVSSAMAMTLEDVKQRCLFYTDQAKKSKVHCQVEIFENKADYPNFDWQFVERFWTDKRKENGGNANAGRKKKERVEGDEPKNTTVQVEPSIIKACKEKHGSLANALRFAAK
jgi:hypothetical protein